MRRILKRNPRAWFWLLIAVALVCVSTVAIVLLITLRSPFNQSVYDRIELGMTLEEVTTILGMPPGCYQVSPEEKFVNMAHKGKIVFGTEDYQDVEKEPAVFDIVSRKTGETEASFLKWVNRENGVFLLTQEGKVIGKMYVVSLTSFNQSKWLGDLRRKFGL